MQAGCKRAFDLEMGNPEKIQGLKSRIAANPFDAVAWEQLLGEISKGRKTDDQDAQLREVYEDLLGKFPTAVGIPPYDVK